MSLGVHACIHVSPYKCVRKHVEAKGQLSTFSLSLPCPLSSPPPRPFPGIQVLSFRLDRLSRRPRNPPDLVSTTPACRWQVLSATPSICTWVQRMICGFLFLLGKRFPEPSPWPPDFQQQHQSPYPVPLFLINPELSEAPRTLCKKHFSGSDPGHTPVAREGLYKL